MVRFDERGSEAERVLVRWRWRILRRAGMCECLADRVAITCEIDAMQFSELVGQGCEPMNALRILAPDDWTSIPELHDAN
jgi:uncharacterized protein (DUF2336 family)